jgi:hypothetical protein
MKAFNRHVSIREDGLALTIEFDDEEESLFHAQWLWRNNPSFIHPSSGQHTHSLALFYGWKIRTAQFVSSTEASRGNAILPVPPPPRGCLHSVGTVYSLNNSNNNHPGTSEKTESNMLLRVDWEGHDDDTATSFYDLDWLSRCRYDDRALSRGHSESLVDKEHAIHSTSSLHEEDYACLMRSDDDNNDFLYAFLSAVVRDGAAKVFNAPREDLAVTEVARLLAGDISHSQLYGDTFHVQVVPGAENIAYTSGRLEPHQDLVYYESPPGLQLLHCLANSTQGGESTLIDAMAAATEFRRICPDLFQILVQDEATFLKQRQGADIMYRRSHIQVDSQGHVVSVHWAPPFEGPLLIPSDRVEDYYVARCAFECMLDHSLPSNRRLLPMLDESTEQALRAYAEKYTWEQALQPGEILVFNNQRMLHGRNAYQNTSERHLVGCYTNIDDTMNQYRLLRRARTKDSSSFIRNVGNGSSSVL